MCGKLKVCVYGSFADIVGTLMGGGPSRKSSAFVCVVRREWAEFGRPI
jgi:hypothetical protein